MTRHMRCTRMASLGAVCNITQGMNPTKMESGIDGNMYITSVAL